MRDSKFKEKVDAWVQKTIRRIETPFASLEIEVVHAFLNMHECAAIVAEPWLIVEDDGFATVRAALWPAFRHFGSWVRDQVLDEVLEDMKGATMESLFVESTKRLKLLKGDDNPEPDIHSKLVLRTLWELIGHINNPRQVINITQEAASRGGNEVHFEFITFDKDRPLHHMKVRSDGNCWISAPMRQLKHLHLKTKWRSNGEIDTGSEGGALVEVLRQKELLVKRLNASPELLISCAARVNMEAEGFSPPSVWPKQMEFSMTDALELEHKYSYKKNMFTVTLVSKGVPQEAAESLYAVYGNDCEGAIKQYDAEQQRLKALNKV